MGVNKVVFGNEEIVNLTDAKVTAAQILSGAKAYDQNGDLIPGSCNYDAYTGDANATEDLILATTPVTTAYVKGEKVTGKMPNIGTQKVEISRADAPVAISRGYHDGSGYATISDAEKDKLIASNIRNGVRILGVLGSMTGEEDVTSTPKTVTPKVTGYTLSPSTDNVDYFSEIIVEAISRTVAATAGTTGTTVTIGQV